MLRFSIIIPTFNYARFLKRAIDSVLMQNCESLEIIVVNDGSTDKTAEILDSYGSKIVVIDQKNSGVSVARNRGAKAAQGEWLLFLDADDALQSGATKAFESVITENAEARFIIAASVSVDENGHQKSPSHPNVSANREDNFKRFINRQLSIAHGAVLMHRTNFEVVQYPVGIKNGEDIVLFAQSLALFDAVSLDAVTVQRFAHENRQRNKIDSIRESELKTVETLFSKEILPENFFKYRKQFEARRYLSLGRSLLKSGSIKDARACYLAALKIQPRLFFCSKHLIRLIKTYFAKERVS